MFTTLLLGQAVPDVAPAAGVAVFETRYWAPVLMGVLLALAFELVLTTLAIAAGLSVGGQLLPATDDSDRDDLADGVASLGSRVRGAVHACGAWATVSGVVSLFFATWLAVGMSLSANEAIGATLGLVIWAIFFLVLFCVDFTIGGAALRAATSGLRAMTEGIGSFFRSSPARAEVRTAVRTVRDELLGSRDFRELKRDLHRYLSDANGDSREREGNDNLRRAAAALGDEHEPLADRTLEGVLRAAGYSDADARRLRSRMEAYLASTGRDEFDPDAIKNEIEQVFADGGDALRQRIGQLDRDSLKSLLVTREDLSEDDVERIFRWIDDALAAVRGRLERAHGTVESYLARVDDPRLRLDEIEAELGQIGEDPRGAAEALLTRLRSLDRDTLVKLLAAREDVSGERAEEIVSGIEQARDSLIQRVEALRVAAEERIEEARRAAGQAGYEVRETAAATAWWGVGAATLSGTAAVVGGLLGVAG